MAPSGLGAIQVLRNAVGGGGGVGIPGKKRYEGVQFNVISVTRGWVGVKFPGKKRYVTLEWPLKLELAEKTLIFIILLCSNVSAIYSVSLHCINIVHYNRFTFVPYEHWNHNR